MGGISHVPWEACFSSCEVFLIITLIVIGEVKSITNKNDSSTQKNIKISNIKSTELLFT